jgi:hypothetical protein
LVFFLEDFFFTVLFKEFFVFLIFLRALVLLTHLLIFVLISVRLLVGGLLPSLFLLIVEPLDYV